MKLTNKEKIKVRKMTLTDKKKIEKALKAIDDLIKHYEIMKSAMKEGLADARIEDLVEIKKILEE